MSTLSCANSVPSELIRYVKPMHINNNEIKAEAFQLREDRTPPEEYISFYHSEQDSKIERIKDVKSILVSNNFTVKPTGGFLVLDVSQASKNINRTKKIVDFEERTYPHYGMYYLSKDIADITEAQTLLMFYSELAKRVKKGNSTEWEIIT